MPYENISSVPVRSISLISQKKSDGKMKLARDSSIKLIEFQENITPK